MKIKIEIEFELSESMFNLTDQGEKEWFEGEVMKPENLAIWSQEIGDYVTEEITSVKWEIKEENGTKQISIQST